MEAKLDRRKERTRRLLRDALMELIVEKGYEAITIQDITERANVARPTFYLHYKDKDELLLKESAAMYDELVREHGALTRKAILDNDMSAMMIDTTDFDHVAQFADFYRVMLSERGSLTFFIGVLRYLQNVAAQDILSSLKSDNQPPRLPTGLLAKFLGWHEAMVTDWWLHEGGEYSAEQMAQMQYCLCMFGLSWALRLDVTPPDITFP